MSNMLDNVYVSDAEITISEQSFQIASEVVPMAPMRMVSFEEEC